jgi:poly-gamma-glutamate capsule biosynthesis protein CapA/YwtB (metallophosphatase superfamily)
MMPDGPLCIAAIGDIMPGPPGLFPGGAPVSEGLRQTVELFAGTDVSVGNLDSVLSHRGYPREKLITLRREPAVAEDLARIGFDVISVANNHATDYGEVGLQDTIEALESAGVKAVGGGEDLHEATAPVIVEASGWRVGVTAWTACLPTGAAAAPDRPGVAPLHVHTSYEVNPLLLMEEPATVPTVRSHVDELDLDAAREVLSQLGTEADFVVVLVHWGGGLSEGLAEYQRPLGRALIDAGADVVVGAHPHRVLGIERYEGKAIIYSGGTLIDQMDRSIVPAELRPILEMVSPDSFVVTLDIAPDRSYALRVTPVTVDGDGVPLPATGEAFDRIADRLVALSAELDTEVRVGDGELVVALDSAVAA